MPTPESALTRDADSRSPRSIKEARSMSQDLQGTRSPDLRRDRAEARRQERGGGAEDRARSTAPTTRSRPCSPPATRRRNSPVHRAVWDRELPVDLFAPEPPDGPAGLRAGDGRRRSTSSAATSPARTLLDEHGKIADPVFARPGRGRLLGPAGRPASTAARARRSRRSRRS